MKTTIKNPSTPFQSALVCALLEYVRREQHSGTTAMSVENLMQCVPAPSSNLAGAPLGTNARYYYAQLFRETCANVEHLRRFTAGF